MSTSNPSPSPGTGTDTGPGTVERAFAAALYDDTDAALDTGASLLAADPAADAELARRGEDLVAAAWRRGWQPADVVRIVRRELDEVHVRLLAALIRAQAEQDGRPRGRRWQAQVEELALRDGGAGRGGGADRDGRAGRPDRFSHATDVLRLYRLLLRLPTLESLDEPSPDHGRGGGRGGSKGGPHTGDRPPAETRMLTRIRALLAKAEATDFPEEAESLTGKAQELMARHSIDEALLAAGTPAGDIPVAWRIGVDAPYEQAKAILLDAVATANHCRSVWNEPFGFSTVVGFGSDLEAVELLYTSLLVQGTAAMTKAEARLHAGKGARGAARKRTRTFRQSFLAAYAHAMGARLEAATEAQVSEAQEADGGLLPVLASREVAVSAETERLFPETVSTRLRGVSDAEGWRQGTRAAEQARVGHGPGLPGRR